MDLAQLQSMGLISGNPLVERQIKVRYRPLLPKEKWKDPAIEERSEDLVEGTVTVYLRKQTAADQVFMGAAQAKGRDILYTMLHRQVYTKDGVHLFPREEDSYGLDLTMFAGLMRELHELNGDGAKKSQPRTKRGARSRSPSAAAASRNGSRTSLPKSTDSGSNTEISTVP